MKLTREEIEICEVLIELWGLKTASGIPIVMYYIKVTQFNSVPAF